MFRRFTSRLSLVLVLGLAVLAAAPGRAPANTAGEARHSHPADTLSATEYDSLVRATRSAWEVPGVSVAVVEDGNVSFVRGYGVRDRKTDRPVTAQTLFATASVTKSFTALALSDQVQRGKLTWSTPVHARLPAFSLQGEYGTLHATPLDLLTHRTGLAKHDFAWYAADSVPFDRAEAIERIGHLPLQGEFRGGYHYTNWGYVAAGRLVGAVAGSSWEAVVRSRLLEPLGMDRTYLRLDSLSARPNHAVGYTTQFFRPDGELRSTYRTTATDLIDQPAMAPVGSLVSSAEDMARWARLHLNEGSPEGDRVVAAGAVRATHLPRVIKRPRGRFPELGTPMYGLGWSVQSYRGHRVVFHSGGLPGFSAMVALLPREDDGVVILSNRNDTFFPMDLLYSTLDRLIEKPPVDWTNRYKKRFERRLQALEKQAAAAQAESAPANPADPGRPLHDYVGIYRHPGYGTIRVLSQENRLEARFHGIEMRLAPAGQNRFLPRADPTFVRARQPVFQFRASTDGSIDRVVIPFAPETDPIPFRRTSEHQSTDDRED